MSCNGCRVLRKGCGEACILRPCLQWIDSAEAQANATIFAAKFFGRAALMGLISAVPENQRPALFQSLLHEACGRTVNPVGGAVGLLCSGNWRACQAAVETVLKGVELKRPTLQHSQRCDGKNNVMEESAQRKRCRNSSTEVVGKDFASTEFAGKDPKPRVHRITGVHYMGCKKIMSKGARLLNVLPNVMAQEPKTTDKARAELVGELEQRSAKQCKSVHVPNGDGIGGPLHGIVEERSPSTLSICELSLSLSSPLRKEKDPSLVVTSPSTVSVTTSEGSVSCMVPTPLVREPKLLHLRL